MSSVTHKNSHTSLSCMVFWPEMEWPLVYRLYWIEISCYCILAIWDFRKFSGSEDKKINIKWLIEALILMVLLLSCHPKRKLFIFGQYGDTTSFWILYVKDHRTFITIILLDWSCQWLTFAVKVNTDSVLSNLYFLIKYVWRQSQQMSKYHPFKNSSALTHAVQNWIIYWMAEKTSKTSESKSWDNTQDFMNGPCKPYIMPTV